MFEVKIMVEDKKLSKVMWSLDGQIVGAPQILPVRGAVAHKGPNGSSTVRQVGEGSMQGRFEKAVQEDGRNEFTTKELKDILVKIGCNINSSSTLIYVLTQRKVLKKAGKGHYKRIS